MKFWSGATPNRENRTLDQITEARQRARDRQLQIAKSEIIDALTAEERIALCELHVPQLVSRARRDPFSPLVEAALAGVGRGGESS